MKLKLLALTMGVSLALFVAAPFSTSAAPADAPAGGTLQQRIELRKKEQKVKLETKELVRLKGRCVGTQNTVRDIQTGLGKIISDRQATYKTIDAKLWIMVGQLKLANKDTFQLENQRAELAKRVAAHDNTLNQYRQTVDDLVVMNCEADLNGFISLVKTAREYHTLIRTQSADIKAYVVDTVKKTLSDFATELQPKAATESDGDGSQ